MSKKRKATYDYTCSLDSKVTKCECNKPFIDVELSLGEKSIVLQALVDSGCEMNHVNAEVAELLGIDLSICTEVTTVGIYGEGTSYMYTVDYSVIGCGDKYSGPVIFVPNLPFSVLLWQINFFDKFDVSFSKSRRKFSIEFVG